MDIFLKNNHFDGSTIEILKFVSGIHFLMINTSLIEKISYVHKVILDVFFHQCTSVVLTIILEKNMKKRLLFLNVKITFGNLPCWLF